MSSILFAAKHSSVTLRTGRPVFVAVICRSHGGLSANEKEETFASNDNSNKRSKANNQSNWMDVNQLTIYMLDREFELGLTTKNKSSYRGHGGWGGGLELGVSGVQVQPSNRAAMPPPVTFHASQKSLLVTPYKIVSVLRLPSNIFQNHPAFVYHARPS